MRDRFLPDKAIDVIDAATARLRMQLESRPTALDQQERLLTRRRAELETLRSLPQAHLRADQAGRDARSRDRGAGAARCGRRRSVGAAAERSCGPAANGPGHRGKHTPARRRRGRGRRDARRRNPLRRPAAPARHSARALQPRWRAPRCAGGNAVVADKRAAGAHRRGDRRALRRARLAHA